MSNVKDPDEVIDPTRLANDLTVELGASARFAFGRSVRSNTGDVRTAAMKYAGHLDEWPAFTREVFAYLYDPDGLKPLPEDEQSSFARAAIHALEQQPAFPLLRSSASAHRVIASKSSAKLSLVVGAALGLDKIPEDDIASQEPREAQSVVDTVNEMMQEAGASSEQISDALADAGASAIESNTHRASIMANLEQAMKTRAIGSLVEAAAKEAEEQAEAVSAMAGFGLGGSSEDGDDGIDAELLEMVTGNPDLLKILKECGRLRESASAKGMATTTTGNCDVVGVVPGDDALRLIPSELAMLDDADLGDYTLARLIDSETLCWEMEGTDYKDRGDIILVVDRSGSMYGPTIVFARALAAASLMNAVGQRRRVVLCMFGSGPCTVVNVSGKRGMKDAIKALGLPASGGTDTPRAFQAVIDHGFADLRDPDVLLITDGCFPNCEALKKQIKRFPPETRFSGLMLNADWDGDVRGGASYDHDWMAERWSVQPGSDDVASDSETLIKIVSTIGSKNAKKVRRD